MPANITIQKFESLKDDRKFNIFYITPPCVNVNTVKDVLYMDETSKKEMQKHFENLSASDLNKKGIGVIFGTFEGLHLGHRSMLKTAKALCSELYIGIEDQQKALERKRNKHPIQSNESRKKKIEDSGVADSEHIFVRESAKKDIERIRHEGKEIKTLFVGETQNDNNEIIDAVEYCIKEGIQVLAITRLRTTNNALDISSTSLYNFKKGKGR